MLKKHILFLFLFLSLITIPIGFASDNATLYESQLAVSDNDEILTVNDIYFNSSVITDGDGSQSNPYKYFNTNKLADDSVVYFASGEYVINGAVSFSNLTIIGQDSSNTILKSNSLVITSKDTLRLYNITLSGLSIRNDYYLTASNVIFQNCNGVSKDGYGNVFGGAIYISGYGTTTIESSTFKNSTATYGAAIYQTGSNKLKISNSRFENNNAYKYGGAIASENNANLEINDSSFINCYTITNAGGAVYTKESALTVRKSNFTSCNATFGGAICDLSSKSAIDSITANENRANYQGGAIYKMYGTMDINSSSFTSNEALNGGAIYADNSSSFSIKSSSFTSNKASYCGGAIYTILNTKEDLTSINYNNNKAVTENNYYMAEKFELFIGNGNYTQFKGNFEFNGILPSKYDLRDYGWVTPVRNQKSSGNCWAFTSLAALESCILKATGQSYDLSEENMKNVMAYYSDYGWKLTTNRGGYDDMGVGYLVSWLGAMPEDLETFSDYSVLSPVLNSSIHVQNIVYLTRTSYTDNDNIKEAIIKYGAVATGIHYTNAYSKSNSYYYPGSKGANHAVTIVGWDDSYSKNNFNNVPAGNGAWICKNSWGTDWGKEGYFYVSYYDTRCVKLGVSEKSTYTIILNDTVHYDKNYQYDIIGITDYFLTGKDTIWYENIFNATGDEFLTAFSTYFNATSNWTAHIYVNNALKLTQSGIATPGYYTYNLNKFIPLKTGDTFKIVIKLSCDNVASFPVSEKVRSNRVLYSPGVSFFSYDGETWYDLFNYSLDMSQQGHTYSSQVACIKAFTSKTLNSEISINVADLVAADSLFDITAVVKDQAGNLIESGNVVFNVDSKTYNQPVVNGKATINVKITSRGVYKIEAQYLKNNVYLNSTASKNIDVVKHANLTLDISDINYGNKITIKNTLLSNGEAVSGYIDVKINSKNYSVKSNGQTTIDDILSTGRYVAYASYSNIANATTTFNVNKAPVSMNLNIQKTDVDAVNIIVTLSKAINASISLNVGSNAYSLKTVNGVANLALNDLDYGNYTVKATFTNNLYTNANAEGAFSVNNIKTHLSANDTVAYYKDGSRFSVGLFDKNNNPLVGESIVININNVNYPKVTNSNGRASISLGLNSGNYTVSVTYSGNGKYLFSKLTKNVSIKSTIISQDVVKYFRNATQFRATILDAKGNKVVNTQVTMNINGVFYVRNTSKEGVVRLNLNLEQGHYVLTTVNPITGENAANNINILPTITDNHDLVKYYRNASQYSVKILSATGLPVSDVKVTFNINGVFYDRSTNANGVARLNINLQPGNYVITAEYNNCRVSNNIRVLSVIKTSDMSMKYQDGSQFKATILDGSGNPFASRKVSFNINGVLYDRTTKDNGVAVLNIRLQPGKYIITTSYNGLNAANTITISS